MADNPKAVMLGLIDAAYLRGAKDASADTVAEDVQGYADIEVRARERIEQIETGGIIRAAIASCDGCSEGETPTISALHKIWVHNQYEPFAGGVRVSEEIRCDAPNIWTYLALRAKKRVDAKKGGQ